MSPIRLDLLLVQRHLAESRTRAQALIAAGKVRLNGQVVTRPGLKVDETAEIAVEEGLRFVSRGGEKLEAALNAFGINVNGRVCADLGASSGGFTDCLLQRGARRVYAIDVGRQLLHPKLRADPRVVVMEGVNARYLTSLPEPVSLVTIDVSFISLRLIFPVVKGWLERQGEIVALVKPQFEAGREAVARGRGVIRQAELQEKVVQQVLDSAQSLGLVARGVIRSPVATENLEFLCYLSVEG